MSVSAVGSCFLLVPGKCAAALCWLRQAGVSPGLAGWCLRDGARQPKGQTGGSCVNFVVGGGLWHACRLWGRQALWMGGQVHHRDTWLGGGGARW